MTDTNADTLRTLHDPCGCEHPLDADNPVLAKDGCTVTIDDAQIALDCDDCDAFGPSVRRPDLIGIRTCDDADEWLVIEMKSTMREHAASQAAAGLDRLGTHPLFPMDIAAAQVIFVVGRNNRAAQTILRSISPIRAGQRTVIPQLVQSGGRIPCPSSPDGQTSTSTTALDKGASDSPATELRCGHG